jgi:RND family efflux transporter MFP subunit
MKPRQFIATASLLGACMFAGCGRKTEATAAAKTLPTATVRAETIQRKERVATEEVVGTVRAKLRSVIEAKVSGKIEKMLVVPGETVKAGELLAQLDAREIQSQLDQALALRQQADSDLKRIAPLAQQRVMSQTELDSAQAKFSVAEAAVTQAQTMLGYTKILAPFDGIITRKYSDVGDLAAPGKPLLEMEDAKILRLEVDAPEAVIGNVALGDKLPVRIANMTNELESVVGEISPAADANSRTFLVKLNLPPAAGLRAGQFGRAIMPVGETSALRVPATAVVQRGQMETVFVVANGKAQLRLVKTGKTVGNEIEVVSGLDAGERVVVEGAGQLLDGQPLNIQP